jgi:hypothetical protein
MPQADHALKQLQSRIRAKPGSGALILDLKDQEFLRNAISAVTADLRLEHLKDIPRVVQDLTTECWREKGSDHVTSFLQANVQQPTTHLCHVAIDHLEVPEPLEVLGIRLLPVASEEIPKPPAPDPFRFDPTTNGVAVVSVTGTNRRLMAQRASELVAHALRVLRVGLRENNAINNKQLRFRVGRIHIFDDCSWGWDDGPEASYQLEADSNLVDILGTPAIASLPMHPSNDIERQADLALRWMERSRFEGDPLVAMLYLFYALEALLGSTDEGLKGPMLAFRATMLSHVVDGQFFHPNETLFLYDEVRSVAVHGEARPIVTEDAVTRYEPNVRWALRQYLTLADREKFTKRSQLVRFLHESSAKTELITWVRANPSTKWKDYLDKLDRHEVPDEGAAQ